MKDDLTLLFVGCDGYTGFTKLAIAEFKEWDVQKINASHTESVERDDTCDILTPEFFDKPTDIMPLGRDILVPRILKVIREHIRTPYILWVMSDQLYKEPNINKFKSWIEVMKTFNITNLKVSIHGTPGEENGNEIVHSSKSTGIIKWGYKSPYLVAHHGSIFEKNYLINTLQFTLDSYGNMGYDHEMTYYIGGWFNPARVELVKQKNTDNRQIRCAYVTEPRVEIISCLSLGKLTECGYEYIQNCSLIEADPLKKFKIGEFCPQKL